MAFPIGKKMQAAAIEAPPTDKRYLSVYLGSFPVSQGGKFACLTDLILHQVGVFP